MTYRQVVESEKAVDIFYEYLGPVGMATLTEYGSGRVVADITGKVCIHLLHLERMEEFNKMFKLTQQLHPRRPSTKTLCEMLHLTSHAEREILTAEDWELDDKTRKECEIRADCLGIPHELFEQCAQEFLDRRLTIPDLLQVCQDVQDMLPSRCN